MLLSGGFGTFDVAVRCKAGELRDAEELGVILFNQGQGQG